VVFAGLLGLAGFVTGVFFFKHPLQEELQSVWAKIRRR
jgi:hypothetical protein